MSYRHPQLVGHQKAECTAFGAAVAQGNTWAGSCVAGLRILVALRYWTSGSLAGPMMLCWQGLSGPRWGPTLQEVVCVDMSSWLFPFVCHPILFSVATFVTCTAFPVIFFLQPFDVYDGDDCTERRNIILWLKP